MADLSAAIKAAQTAAANIVDAEVTQETLPATQTAAPVAVNYSKPSMANAPQTGGLAGVVDDWLKVDEFGLNVGADRKKHESVLVDIDMTEERGFTIKESIKWGNNPTNYASRYSGTLADNGQPWAAVIEKAQRVDPGTPVYPSADILLVVAEPIPLGKGDPVAVGTKLGLTLSRSNWRNWETFYKEVARAGLLDTVVRVRIWGEEVSGKKNGHTWGVMKFELAEQPAMAG